MLSMSIYSRYLVFIVLFETLHWLTSCPEDMDVLRIKKSDQVFGVLRHFTYSFMIAHILKDRHLVKRDIQSLYLLVSFAIVSLRAERESWLLIFLYIKTCLKRPLKITPKLVFNTDYR